MTEAPRDPTDVLAGWSSALDLDEVPPSARRHATDLLLDALVCAVAADHAEDTAPFRAVADAVGGLGTSTVVGESQPRSLGTAVLGTILATVLTSQVTAALQGVEGLPEQAVNPLAEAIAESGGTVIVTLNDAAAAEAFAGQPSEPFVQPVLDASVEGYTDATRITLTIGALVILLGGAAAARLPKQG